MHKCRQAKWAINDFCLVPVSPPFVLTSWPLPSCLLCGPLQFDRSLPFNFFCNLSSPFTTLFFFSFLPPFPHWIFALPPLFTFFHPLSLPLFHPTTRPTPHPQSPPLFPTTASSSLFHYQMSACASEPNTWSMRRHSGMVSPRTNSSPWSDSLSCSAKPTRCFVPETWAPSSATSSSQSWTTSRPSGPTTWAEICSRPWRESSSLTPWGWQQAQRVSACWSVWTRMTTRRAESCSQKPSALGVTFRHPVTVGVQRLTGLYRLMMTLWGVLY